MRLRLVKEHTTVDFFKSWKIWIGISAVLVVLDWMYAVGSAWLGLF